MTLTANKTSHRILIAVNEALANLLLVQMMERKGHHIIGTADRTSHALQLADTKMLSFAILDDHLNGESTYMVARRLNDRHVPYIICSGNVTKSFPIDISPVAHFKKPLCQSDLKALLDILSMPQNDNNPALKVAAYSDA